MKKNTMKKPKLAVIDGDIIAWKSAFIADSEGALVIDSVISNLIKKWTPKGVTKVIVALSDKANFRKDLFPDYKANRASVVKPDSLGASFEILRERYDTLTLPELEADDILGIYASSGKGISVSIDKDLKGVPGWYWNPEKDKKPYLIAPEDAEKWFCIQWMAGDSTDGIPGMWMIGKKKAEKLLDQCKDEQWHELITEMYKLEQHAPKKDYGEIDPCVAMGQCVRILQCGNYDMKKKEITELWYPKVGL